MTRTALPHPPRRHQDKQTPTQPRDGRTRTAAHPLTAGIRREAKASPLPETRNETPRRDEHNAPPDEMRRTIRRGEQARQDATASGSQTSENETENETARETMDEATGEG